MGVDQCCMPTSVPHHSKGLFRRMLAACCKRASLMNEDFDGLCHDRRTHWEQLSVQPVGHRTPVTEVVLDPLPRAMQQVPVGRTPRPQTVRS